MLYNYNPLRRKNRTHNYEIATCGLSSAIATNNEPEENLKKLNDYISSFLLMQKDSFQLSFSPEQVAEMQNMAILCPSIYGPGVYGIRALLKSIDSLNVSYLSPCEMAIDPLGQSVGNNQRRGSVSAAQRGDLADFDEVLNEKTTIKNENSISVSPNPASNFVRIESNLDKIGSYELSDLAGNVISNQFGLNSNVFVVDTYKLSSGFYILKLIKSNGKSEQVKISIVK
jgi:hypothetical protein